MAHRSVVSHQSEGVVYLDEERKGPIHVECSPLPGSYPFIALTDFQSVHILRAVFDQGFKDRGYPLLRDEGVSCTFDSEVSLVRWGPGTSVEPEARASSVDLCVSCGDKLFYCSKPFESNRLKRVEVGKHSAMITDAAFPAISRASKLVSVGEDCRLRVWDLEGRKNTDVFHLGSAGTNVRWYDDGNQSLLFVAEESGAVSLRDLRSGPGSCGLDLRRSVHAEDRLQSMDWTECFPDWIGGVANNTWHLWDLKMTSAPVQSGAIATSKPVTSFRWGRNPRSPQQPIFLTSGFGHWQLWEVQQDKHQIGRVSGVHWRGENPKMFTGNASLFQGGPSVLVGDYKQLEFANKLFLR